MSRNPLAQTFKSLERPNFRLYWAGQVVSSTGTWMQAIAQAWLVIKLTDSPFALGLIAACQALPVLFFSLYGGALADRLPKRRVITITQSAMLVQATALAALTGLGWLNIGGLCVLSTVLGIAFAVDLPARQAFLNELVGPADLPNAAALNALTREAARLVGPALAAVTIATLGLTACFAVNAVSFLAAIGALLLMRPERFVAPPPPAEGRLLPQIRDGVRYAFSAPELGPILLICAAFGIFGLNFNVLLPLVARYILGAGPVGLSVLTSSLAIGSLTGALTVAYRNAATARMLLAGAASFSLALFCLGISGRWLFTVPAVIALGICTMVYFTTSTSRVQVLTEPAYRGRVMGLYSLLDIGTAPVGVILMGVLAGRIGARPTVVLFAAACGLGTLAGGLFLRRQRHGAAESNVSEALPIGG